MRFSSGSTLIVEATLRATSSSVESSRVRSSVDRAVRVVVNRRRDRGGLRRQIRDRHDEAEAAADLAQRQVADKYILTAEADTIDGGGAAAHAIERAGEARIARVGELRLQRLIARTPDEIAGAVQVKRAAVPGDVDVVDLLDEPRHREIDDDRTAKLATFVHGSRGADQQPLSSGVVVRRGPARLLIRVGLGNGQRICGLRHRREVGRQSALQPDRRVAAGDPARADVVDRCDIEVGVVA